jgi:transcription elongation factor Elf1
MWDKKMKCPKCGRLLEVDSIREHKDGHKRVYWECKDCNISIMDRSGS